MNKYIKTDIEQGITFLKVAINNALADLEEGKEKEIRFEIPLPLQLIIKCAEDRGWEDDHDDDWTNGWEVDYYYRMVNPNIKDKCLGIGGSLLCGNTHIYLDSTYE
jgi:hypothetical protein